VICQCHRTFEPFGEISAVKIPPGKGCGFVHYLHRISAEHAITAMHGQFVGKIQLIRLLQCISLTRVCHVACE
jgi:RNA recognition motif-containing protein